MDNVLLVGQELTKDKSNDKIRKAEKCTEKQRNAQKSRCSCRKAVPSGLGREDDDKVALQERHPIQVDVLLRQPGNDNDNVKRSFLMRILSILLY